MSKKKVKMTQFSILSSLAVVLAFWIVGQAACAAAPTDGAAATLSHGGKALETAAKDNKYLFIFFYKEDTQHSRVMRTVFQTALAKLAATAQSVEIQTEDPAEQQLVTRYGVSRAPLPLVLVIAPNGAITKGFPTQFDENQLRQAFVSPCTAQCMKALQDRKLVLLCVQQPSPQAQQAAFPRGVQEFTTNEPYSRNSKVVLLNASDPAEAAFLKSLQVDPQTTTPVTVLMSPPGSVVGTFVGDVTKAELIAKLKSASSCGPGCSCHH
jgi:hypothetical protein